MRNRDTLLNVLPEVLTLCQYLYIKEGNCVEVPGMVPGTRFRFSMTEDLDIIQQFMPNLGDRHQQKWMPPSVDREMIISKFCDVVQNLKKLPAKEFPDRFNSRWDEIEHITLDMVAINRLHQKEDK